MEKVAPENYDKNDKIPKSVRENGVIISYTIRGTSCEYTHTMVLSKIQLKELDEERERSSDRKPQINVTQQKVTTKYTQHLSKQPKHKAQTKQNDSQITNFKNFRKISIFLSLSRKSVYTNSYKVDLKMAHYPGATIKSTPSWDQKVFGFWKKWHPKIMTRMTKFRCLYK